MTSNDHNNVNKNRKKLHMSIWNRSNFNPIFFFSVHWSKDRPTALLYHNVKLKVNASIQMGFPSWIPYAITFLFISSHFMRSFNYKVFSNKMHTFFLLSFCLCIFFCLFTLVRNKLNDAFMEWCVYTCNWIKS